MIFGVPELEDLPDVEGRSVLVRVDFNVPLSDGVITDDLRIRAALPTLRWLVKRGAKVTACSHLGRPKGEAKPEFSLGPVREHLASLVPEVELIENLRFDPGEEANSPDTVARLIEGHDFYVNDAFGASHPEPTPRSSAPPAHLPSAAGRLLAREVEVLLGLRRSDRGGPVRGHHGRSQGVGQAGGHRVVARRRRRSIIVGGGMAFTFLKARGHSVGSSLLEDDMVDTCARLLDGPKTDPPPPRT